MGGADLSAFLFHLVEPSEFQPRPAARLSRLHASPDVVCNLLLQMESQFGIEMFLCEPFFGRSVGTSA